MALSSAMETGAEGSCGRCLVLAVALPFPLFLTVVILRHAARRRTLRLQLVLVLLSALVPCPPSLRALSVLCGS